MDRELQLNSLELANNILTMLKAGSKAQLKIGRDYPELLTDPELNKEYLDIQKLQEQKMKEAVNKIFDQKQEDIVLKQIQPYSEEIIGTDLIVGTNLDDQQKGKVRIRFLLRLLEKFWNASSTGDQFELLMCISQMADIMDDDSIEELAKQMLLHQDFRLRGEMCYLLGQTGRLKYLPMVKNLLNDPDSWVRGQASKALKRLTVQILENLISFVDDTYERFYNENRRFQVLARIRKVLREQLFDYLPTGSVDKGLVTAIINATNRTTAKNFRKKYLSIFKDSLCALRDGHTDPETMINLEKRLLEIDDELYTKAIPRHHDSD